MKNQAQKKVSETFLLAALLALVGGFQDAYSYVGRAHVFSNAQTGNIILLGVNLVDRNAEGVIRYALPVICFTAGILLACLLRQHVGSGRFLHFHQRILLIEIALLMTNYLMPFGQHDVLASSLISFSCAIQVENFKRFRNVPAATTMCIGNLKNGMENLCQYLEHREIEKLHNFLTYAGIILVFTAGAILGNKCTELFAHKAILICALLLLLPFALLFQEDKDVL